ncbi:NXPE family member 1-like [Rhinophrynus dorsalis]
MPNGDCTVIDQRQVASSRKGLTNATTNLDCLMILRVSIPSTHLKVKNVPDIQKKVNEILMKIDLMIPKIHVLHKNNTTCALKSRATIRNPKETYCVGDDLIVQVDVFDFLGKRKTYGGDYLRARISNKELEAGASGKIEDFNNGTYYVHFTLFWEGSIDISVLLIHPSEGVSALWNARNRWYGYIGNMGKFTNQNKHTESKCGFELDRSEELCEYVDERDEEYFYCVKPSNYSCDSLTETKSYYTNRSNLTKIEVSLFESSSFKVEIPKDFPYINVSKCNKNTIIKPKCKIGMKLEYPGGYFMKNAWNPKMCSIQNFHSMEELNKCMQGKFIYIFGDSTLRQWMEFFQSKLKTLTMFNLYEGGWARKLLGLDLKRNMRVVWKRHGNPFISTSYQSCREDRTIPREIDLIGGHQQTVIVLNVGVHFRAYPVHHYIRRLINIRRALEHLFHRSPETKVIIKTENTAGIETNHESRGDFHALIHYFILEFVFKDLNVGFVNGWDMTAAFDTKNVHPPQIYIQNEIDMLMTYIC